MDLQGLNVLDLIFGAIIVISTLVGIARGFVREILSLLAWVISIWASVKFAPFVAETWVRKFIDTKPIDIIASIGIVFLLTLFLIGLINLLLSSLLASDKNLGGFNRSLGMIFGFLRGVVICSLGILLVQKVYSELEQTETWQKSKLAGGFINLAEKGAAAIPEDMRGKLSNFFVSAAEKANSSESKLNNSGENKTSNESTNTSGIVLSSMEQNSNSATRPLISEEQKQQRQQRADSDHDMQNNSNPRIKLDSMEQ